MYCILGMVTYVRGEAQRRAERERASRGEFSGQGKENSAVAQSRQKVTQRTLIFCHEDAARAQQLRQS